MGKVTASRPRPASESCWTACPGGKRSSSRATTRRWPGSCRRARRGSTRFVAPSRGCASSRTAFAGGPGRSCRTVRSRGHRRGSALMRAFVADASVAIGWVHPAQATRRRTRCWRRSPTARRRGARAVAARGRERAHGPAAPTKADRGRAAGGPGLAAPPPPAPRPRDGPARVLAAVGAGIRSRALGLRRRVPRARAAEGARVGLQGRPAAKGRKAGRRRSVGDQDSEARATARSHFAVDQ